MKTLIIFKKLKFIWFTPYFNEFLFIPRLDCGVYFKQFCWCIDWLNIQISWNH